MTRRCSICHCRLGCKENICKYNYGLTSPCNTPIHRFKSLRMACSTPVQERQHDTEFFCQSSDDEEAGASTTSTMATEEEVECRRPLPKKQKVEKGKKKKTVNTLADKQYLVKLLEKYQRELDGVRKQLDKKIKLYEELRRKNKQVERMIVITEDFLNQLNEDTEGITSYEVAT